MKHISLGLIAIVALLILSMTAAAVPVLPGPFIKLPPDIDGDGILNGPDNCKFTSNADQQNSDDDSYGDACDPYPFDSDNDGVQDNIDNCPLVPNPNQENIDRDNQGGDACDNVNVIPEYSLQDYPTMFISDGAFNGLIVLGENAPVSDHLSATRITQGIHYTDAQGNERAPEGLQQAFVLDEELNADNLFLQNLIVVGSACVNSIAAELLNNPDPCTGDLEPNQSKIQLFQQDGVVIILVTGYGPRTTREAANVLANYEDFKGMLRGRIVLINGAAVDDVVVPPVNNGNAGDNGNTGENNGSTDQDHDGVADAQDNCPQVANPPVNGVQADADHDGLGDACDGAQAGSQPSPTPQTVDGRFKELDDRFNSYDNDYDNLKDKYESAVEREDDKDIKKYKKKLNNLDDDLDTLGKDVNDFLDEVDNDRTKRNLQDDLNNLDDDINTLQDKISKLLNHPSNRQQDNMQDNSYIQPSVAQTGSAPPPQPTGGVTVRMDPSLLPSTTATSTTDTTENANLAPLAWLVAGIVVVGAVLVFLLALLLKK